MMNKVRMFGPLGESSGYGNAVKNFAVAFSNSDIPTKFQFGRKAEGRYSEFMGSLDRYTGDTNVDFYLHGPSWSKHRSKAYKIGYFYWEADRLPISWERMINQVDELWVPCELVAQACRRAKFRGAIKIVPTPINKWDHDKRLYIPSDFSESYEVSSDVFMFYSVFQWHERKGYRELLNAYYKTFTEDDNVLLVIKTNHLGIGKYTRERIKLDILNIKKRLNQTYYPRVYLCRDIIDMQYIQALHNTGDCYVSAHHGEGWGVPIHDAMHAGNHIITTKYGGVTEHLDESTANIVEHKMGPVGGMDWSGLYGDYQNWAYPSIRSLSQQMKKIYLHSDQYIDKTIKAQELAEQMNIDAVSRMINRELATRRGK